MGVRRWQGTRYLIAVVILLFAGSLSADESAILAIRKEYRNIRQALPSLNKARIELSGYSTEGGVATAYRDSKKNIRLIRAELYWESGKAFEEFYYQDGALIFVFHENHRYNVPFNVTPEVAKDVGGEAFDAKKTTVTEDRYYFESRRMLRWIDENKKEVDATSKEFRESEREILKFSDEVRAMFVRKP